jgi:hypothetical protein
MKKRNLLATLIELVTHFLQAKSYRGKVASRDMLIKPPFPYSLADIQSVARVRETGNSSGLF